MDRLVRGHGFHFLLPGASNEEVFLDIIGAPPRVGQFTSALTAARWIETERGTLHTVGIKDLVELKKTQRPEDYAIISKLALTWFDQPGGAGAPEDFCWALQNIFSLAELRILLEEHPTAVTALPSDSPPGLDEFARQLQSTGDVPESVEKDVNNWMQPRMAKFQEADRRYWREIIGELKTLRAVGKLVIEGDPV